MATTPSRVPGPRNTKRQYTSIPPLLFKATMSAQRPGSPPKDPSPPRQDPQPEGKPPRRRKMKPKGKLPQTAAEKRHENFTLLTAQCMETHDRLEKTDKEKAEKYALDWIFSAAERTFDPFPTASLPSLIKLLGVSEAKHPAQRWELCEHLPLPKSLAQGKEKMKPGKRKDAKYGWKDAYIDTYGCTYGKPKLLIESIKPGYGKLEFESGEARRKAGV